ncbi:MAG: ParB/RepB/Spo0J family partition protein [Coleofasciculus sp. D1-CHI-01]|uniref:ParB/RepB/Spo0J family partition protein n=1 Tax=Coleofasciculus sp. D1-CHI-01 TaxID=3068482 RepID=UPI0032FF39A0
MSKKDQPYTSQLKGVAALLGEREEPNAAAVLVPITSIRLPKQQPRRYFDPDKLEQLTSSVRNFGILEPLLVRRLHLDKYELVAGERRYRAAQKVGLTEIPVVIRELTDEEALQLALIENLQREDLNPVEETEAILQLLATQLGSNVEEIPPLLYRMQNEEKGKVTQNVLGNEQAELILTVFDSLGLMSWQSFVSSRLPLLNLPDDVLDALRIGQIAYTKAQALARLKDAPQRQALLNDAIADNLSLKEITQRIKQLKQPTAKPPSLKNRFQETSGRLQKTKFWNDPKKHKKLERLLLQMEALLDEE